MYGAGEDALKLTRQYGDFKNISEYLTTAHKEQKLCMTKESGCVQQDGTWVPPFVLFLGQFIAGIGISLFWTVGIAYMDDNTSKDKTPALLSKHDKKLCAVQISLSSSTGIVSNLQTN